MEKLFALEGVTNLIKIYNPFCDAFVRKLMTGLSIISAMLFR